MYASQGSIGDARRVFDWSVELDMFSWNSLIGGYVGLGDLEMARELFDDMPQRDVVSWSTMIGGCVQVCWLILVCSFIALNCANCIVGSFIFQGVELKQKAS